MSEKENSNQGLFRLSLKILKIEFLKFSFMKRVKSFA